jgi:hypothetical protein
MMRRAWWSVWGVVAGVGGVVANLVTDDQRALREEQVRSGVDVVQHLDRSGYHVGVIAGWVAVAALLAVAAGWQRLARRLGDDDLGWQIVPFGFVAAAGALALAYGFKGALAEYLPGGTNENAFDPAGLYTMFVFNDNAPWVGWWPVVVAAGACAWLALGRRRLPIWLGILSALVVVFPVAVMLGTGAVAIAGVAGPVWLIAISLWLMLWGEPAAKSDAVEP